MTLEVSAPFPPNVAFAENGVSTGITRRPFQGFLTAYVLTIVSLAMAAHFWGKVGFDLLVVALGWPHILLGLAFNLNRISRADLRSQVMFGGLLVLTLAIAVGHSLAPITTLIYLYFVFHALRDEIYIYHERHTGYRFCGRVFDASGWAVFIAVVVGAGVSQLVPRNSLLQSSVYDALCVVAAILSGAVLMRWPRRLLTRWPGVSYALPAFFLILTAMTAMEFLRWHQWNAPLFLTFLVIFHYFSWYVFSLERIEVRVRTLHLKEAPARLFCWTRSRPGFLTVVVALNVLSLALAWSYQIQHAAARLAFAFDLKYFLYFLVLHVTTSFLPKSSAARQIADRPTPRQQRFARKLQAQKS
jgi:hypothetical protein